MRRIYTSLFSHFITASLRGRKLSVFPVDETAAKSGGLNWSTQHFILRLKRWRVENEIQNADRPHFYFVYTLI